MTHTCKQPNNVRTIYSLFELNQSIDTEECFGYFFNGKFPQENMQTMSLQLMET